MTTTAEPNPAPSIDRRINIVPPSPPPAIVQELDRVPSGRVVVIFIAALLVIAVSIVVVIGLEQHPSTHAIATQTAPKTLLGVHQTPIAGPSYASELRGQQMRALRSYGAGSIPIGVAKRMYLERNAPKESAR